MLLLLQRVRESETDCDFYSGKTVEHELLSWFSATLYNVHCNDFFLFRTLVVIVIILSMHILF